MNVLRKYKSLIMSGIVVALIVVYFGVSYIGYGVVATAPARAQANPPTTDYENVTFPARGRTHQVHGYLIITDPSAPIILNVHGRFSSRNNRYNLERAAKMVERGYSVLSIDLSDQGGDTVEDGRSSMGYDEQWDVLGAFDYLLSRGYAPERIGVVAESMGAATSLMAASVEPRIRAVWADSSYTDVYTVISEQSSASGFSPIFVPGGILWGLILAGDNMWDVVPAAKGATLAANNQAVYLIHCTGDTIVYYHHGGDLYEAYQAAGVEVEFWTPPNCQTHTSGMTEDADEYFTRLDNFFQQHLLGA
jgi:uncharacterized protein